MNDRNETNPWSITNQAVEKIIIHPKWVDYGLDYAGYNFSSRAFYNPFYYDIALIKLKVVYSKYSLINLNILIFYFILETG